MFWLHAIGHNGVHWQRAREWQHRTTRWGGLTSSHTPGRLSCGDERSKPDPNPPMLCNARPGPEETLPTDIKLGTFSSTSTPLREEERVGQSQRQTVCVCPIYCHESLLGLQRARPQRACPCAASLFAQRKKKGTKKTLFSLLFFWL